ncbi:MAG: carboxypeptidase regulatory-like domain-containing protein, partial [Cytophagales bacterium]|nr:carboxypeptidase regulatory-like domain-containing protein [Cytophagales bacterium]
MKVVTSRLSGRPRYRLQFLRYLLAMACIAPAGLYNPLRAQPPVQAPGRERPAVVQGRVTDSEGKPVAGASLAVADTRLGTTAGEEGRFRLEIPAGRLLLLTATALGYQPRQVPVQGK